MNLLENITLALNGLKTGKMRALLTMLGIIIGIASVIAIVTLGSSLSGSLTNSMSDMGVNNINVNLRAKDSPADEHGPDAVSAEIEDKDKITTEMIDKLVESYPDDITGVSLTQSAGYGTAKEGRLYSNVSINGASSGYISANNLTMLEGRFITDRDVQGSKNVAVVSDKLVASLFADRESPLEQEVKIYTTDQILTFLIVGVYKYEASAFFGPAAEQDIRTDLYIPVTTAKKLAGAGNNYQNITVTSTQTADKDKLISTIETFFAKNYRNNQKYEVIATSMESMLTQMTSMLSTVQIAIAAIAAISLLVGGIGVMNIMLVSVTERTREIGTRKALGARSSSIRFQFVVESMIICLIGGIIGVVLGLGLGAAGSTLLGSPATASIPVILVAVLFSMVIGVFFGYYPASKAAKLDPIEALRYE